MATSNRPVVTIAEAESRLLEFVDNLAALANEPLDALVAGSEPAIATAEELLRSLTELSADVDGRLGAARRRVGSAIARSRSQLRFADSGIEATSGRLREVARGDRDRAAQLLMIEYADALCDATPAQLEHLLGVGADLGVLDSDTLGRLQGLSVLLAAESWDVAVLEVTAFRDQLRGTRRRAGVARALGRLAVFQAHLYLLDGRLTEAEALLRSELERKSGWFLKSELAYLLILSGALDEARVVAREVVDHNPEQGDGYLAEAALAEESGDGGTAAELYREGLSLLDIVRLEFPERGSLLPATGLLHRERAIRLEEMGLAAPALAAAERALALGVRGPELYPETVVYELQSRLLSQVEGRVSEMQAAAYEAGRRRLWSADISVAIPLLELAAQAGERFPFVGWEIASALQFEAWSGRSSPDPDVVRRGEDTWVAWSELVRPPPDAAGWIYYVGANLAEDLSSAPEQDGETAAAGRFRGLLRAEQSLAHSSGDAKTWGTVARLFAALGLTSNALESSERGSRIDPDEPEVQFVLLRLASNAGQFDRASEILARMPDVERNPWLLGVRGWLRLHRKDPVGAVADLDSAERLGHPQPAWCADVRADARIELQDFEGAAREYRRVVAHEAVGEDADVIRARAHLLLGEVTQAQELLTSIQAHRMPDTVEYLWDCLVLDACLGDTEAMLRHTSEMASQITSLRQLDDARDSLRRSISLLASGSAGASSAAALQPALDLLLAESPMPAPSPEEELDRAMAQHGDNPEAATALRGVLARRLGESGREAEAVTAYESLRGTAFESEATVAVTAILRRLLNAAIAAGDPEVAGRLYDRLGQDEPGFLTRELAVAEALVAGGRSDEALALLETSGSPDPLVRTETDVRLGEIRAARGETDAAVAAMEQALQIATASALVGEIEVARIDLRLGALAAVTDQGERAAAHLANALQLLDHTQVVDPGSVLALELRLALNDMGLPRADLLADEYARLCPDRLADAELLRP